MPVPAQPAEVIHGLQPEGDLTSVTINQGYPDTCAIRSQEIILRDFGIDVSQDQLRQEAMAHGWYTPGGGTPEADVGKLLELHGVGITRYEHANVYNLVSELSAGKRIIVGADSGELWHAGETERMEDATLGPRPDHALIVAGVDTTNPDDVKVILTDPGTGHVAKAYPLAQFVGAWQDSGCEMFCTNAPAPVTASGMVNFDYHTGHLPIGDVPYSEWAEEYAHQMDSACGGIPVSGVDLLPALADITDAPVCDPGFEATGQHEIAADTDLSHGLSEPVWFGTCNG